MIVRELHVRLFKALNYDFRRLHDSTQNLRPWDFYKKAPYPYITVPLDQAVTCIVGSNEAGKSQVLEALWLALTDLEAATAWSCRYSSFFGQDGDVDIAQFGVTIDTISPQDRAAIRDLVDVGDANVRTFHLFRVSDNLYELYLDDQKKRYQLSGDKAAGLLSRLPRTFSIDTKRKLPDSVPLDYILARSSYDPSDSGTNGAVLLRKERIRYLDAALESYRALRALAKQESISGDDLLSLLPRFVREDDDETLDQFDLAWKLLVVVSGIPIAMFEKLHRAIRDEEEGLRSAIEGTINAKLRSGLNMRRWWTQDADFDLQVEALDYDLVFTIRDRTSAQYKFAERSAGLKFFLSYLVQYLAQMRADSPPSILTMDEPDAYLSHQGQQDLLALFDDFVGDGKIHRQVVFVTHSPFLIDRNRADRVRVLHKGVEDEGTRVVKKAVHNHFEPLRSAFGGFVGEQAFIGNCNLILEGQTDQMYVAALCAAAIKAKEEPTAYLDLNRVTLVPAGSSEHVPYMVYLARGRDYDQPAVIVLLDGDQPGDRAKDVLLEGFPKPGQKKRSPLVNPDFIARISNVDFPELQSERPDGPQEIEDVVPLAVLYAAAVQLAADLCGSVDGVPKIDMVRQLLSSEAGHYDALEAAFLDSESDLRLDKFSLAHAVTELIAGGELRPLEDGEPADEVRRASALAHGDAPVLKANFRVLFLGLREMQRKAELERHADGMQKAVRGRIRTFLKLHPTRATRNEVRLLLAEVDSLLDRESAWADKVDLQRKRVERQLGLEEDLASDVADYPKVRARLEKLMKAAEMSLEDLLASEDDDLKNFDERDDVEVQVVGFGDDTESVEPEVADVDGAKGEPPAEPAEDDGVESEAAGEADEGDPDDAEAAGA